MAVKPRKLHITLDPAVEAEIDGHRVTFVGVNLLRPHVMIEYEVDPPIGADSPFGPHLLTLDVTDDTSDALYETAWEDFRWRDIGPRRTTTRLERRPPPEATRLHVIVRPLAAPAPDPPAPDTSPAPAIAQFDVPLPEAHAEPWRPPDG